MKKLIGLLKHPLFIQLVGVIGLCVLIWFAGPLISFANWPPFEAEFNRLLAILIVVVVWALYYIYIQARAKNTDKQLMADLSASPVDQEQAAIAEAKDEEATALRRKFEEALQLLKETKSKGKRGRQYLYALPWYVIIGPPGSGKTTLLNNSELKFPIAERLGRSPVKGIGGTRNCDWLFAEEAVFLDTAGRYTTQDSHQTVDEAAWHGFLDLIKKYRPHRPINGVLVTMSIDNLLRLTEEELRQQAKVLRRRILELYARLGIAVPLYMLFTKCDLVAGFTDFFADLGQEERFQVWGETFSAENFKQTDKHLTLFHDHYEELLERLRQRTFERIHAERDIQRRSLILNFPQQMALMKAAMMPFLRDTFGVSGFEAEPLLRGVYFTSGTQEGTPIDRIMGSLAAAYGLDRHTAPVLSGRGKGYFITSLLKDVIFPEAELASVDPRAVHRRRSIQWAAYASVFILAGVIVSLWTVSFIRNKSAIALFSEQINKHQAVKKEASDSNEEARSLVSRLNILKSATKIYERPSLLMGFGLYQGDKLLSGANLVYGQLLKKELLPLIKHRLEHQLHACLGGGADRSDLGNLYELLKAYLMLGIPEKMDPKFVSAWVKSDWEKSFAREPELYAQLIEHSANLLNSPFDPPSLDENLISRAREKLNTIPLALQIYAYLKGEILPDHSLDFKLSETIGPDGGKVFTTGGGQDIRSLTIPGFYTSAGYNAYFREKGLEFLKGAIEENWVLKNRGADQAGDLNRLHDDLQKLYFADYTKMWQNMLDTLQLQKPQGINQAVDILELLSGPESPLRSLLTAVAKNTILSKPTANESTTKEEKPKGLFGRTPPSGKGAELNDPVYGFLNELDRHFAPLNKLVQGNANFPPPIEAIIATLRNMRDVLLEISSAAKSEDQALRIAKQRMTATGEGDSIKKAINEFRQLPEPVKTWMMTLTSLGWKLTLDTAKTEMDTVWKTNVLNPYKAGIEGRYPIFKGGGNDATIKDFSAFFAPNGILDNFFQTYLKPFVDTTNWRQVALESQPVGISNEIVQQFRYAAKIRDTFFPAGGQTPLINFELKPIALDENIASFRLNIEGKSTTYSHGPSLLENFQWPGPETNAGVRISFRTLDGKEITHSEQGPWAWQKTLDKAVVENTSLPDRFMVTFQLNTYKARYELRANSVNNPFGLKELEKFRCPESL